MNIYFEKARKLADEILASEESKDFAEAAATLENNPGDKGLEADYLILRAEYAELVSGVVNIIQDTLGVKTAGGCGGCGGGSGGGCCGGHK